MGLRPCQASLQSLIPAEGLVEAHSPWQLDENWGWVPPDSVPMEGELQAPRPPGRVRSWTTTELWAPHLNTTSPWAYERGVRYSYTPGGAMWTHGWRPACPWTRFGQGPVWSCHSGKMRGREGAGHVPGSGGGVRPWPRLEGLRRGSGHTETCWGEVLYSWAWSGWRESCTHHPRRREGLAIGALGSPGPSGHSSSPSLSLHWKPSLLGESRWWMPPNQPPPSGPSPHPPPPTAQ